MTSPGRTRDPEQRIHDIGRAAAELIAEAGVGALTHRAVAARAGVAVGTTTRYFATIDDLRKHALEYLAASVEADLRELSLRWFTGLTDILTPCFGKTRSEVLAMCLDGAGINTALTGVAPTPARLEAVIRAISTMPDEDTTA